MWHEQFTDKDDNIKYRFYERFRDPLTDKYRRTSVVMNKNTRPSQNEAQKLLNAKIEQLIKNRLGTNEEIQDKTFHEVATEWLEDYKRTNGSKRGTLKGKETQVRQLLSYIDADVKFIKIGFRHLQDFIYHKSDEGLKQRSLDAYGIVIRAIYAYTRTGEYNFKPEFDVRDLKIPKDIVNYKESTADDDANKYLTQQEIDDILDYIDYKIKQQKRADVQRNLQMYKYIIEFQLLNGMRISELLAIQPHNIDYDNQTLLIDGSIYWGSSPDGFGYKDTTKTKSSRRRIGLTQRSADILRKVMLENKKESSWNDKYNDRGFMFTGSTGSPMPSDKVNRMLKEAAEWTGISNNKKVTTHILRHTHISRLAELDVGLKTIMNRVGHSDYKTTLQIYSHVTDKMNDTMMDKLENANY